MAAGCSIVGAAFKEGEKERKGADIVVRWRGIEGGGSFRLEQASICTIPRLLLSPPGEAKLVQ